MWLLLANFSRDVWGRSKGEVGALSGRGDSPQVEALVPFGDRQAWHWLGILLNFCLPYLSGKDKVYICWPNQW